MNEDLLKMIIPVSFTLLGIVISNVFNYISSNKIIKDKKKMILFEKQIEAADKVLETYIYVYELNIFLIQYLANCSESINLDMLVSYSFLQSELEKVLNKKEDKISFERERSHLFYFLSEGNNLSGDLILHKYYIFQIAMAKRIKDYEDGKKTYNELNKEKIPLLEELNKIKNDLELKMNNIKKELKSNII